jgi:hypothetical protein
MSEDPADRDAALDRALAEYAAGLDAGHAGGRAAFLSARPGLAADLGPLIDSVETLHRAGREVLAGASEVGPVALPGPDARLGDFRLVREVGRGGMGVVYEAVQEPLGRRVALKVLPAGGPDARRRERFVREARTAAALDHPHIVPVFSVHETPDGVGFYAMRFVDGAALDAVVRALRARAGLGRDAAGPGSTGDLLAAGLATGFVGAAPPAAPGAVPRTPHADPRFVRAAARLAADAAGALQYAHDRDVVHRDVKPGNLILDPRGHVWLTDFGLALARSAGGGETTGGRAGTLRYMSPEQAAGRRDLVDGRTDVYGLGATLYELLTLRPAVDAATDSELLRRVADADPTPARRLNPAVPADLETVVHKALAKAPADRYPTAAALAADLRRFLDGRPVLARPLSGPQRLWRWARRRRKPLGVAAAALAAGAVAGLAASGVWVYRAYRAEEAARQQAEGRQAAAEAREQLLLDLVALLDRSERVLMDIPGAQDQQRALVVKAKAVLALLADEPGPPGTSAGSRTGRAAG